MPPSPPKLLAYPLGLLAIVIFYLLSAPLFWILVQKYDPTAAQDPFAGPIVPESIWVEAVRLYNEPFNWLYFNYPSLYELSSSYSRWLYDILP